MTNKTGSKRAFSLMAGFLLISAQATAAVYELTIDEGQIIVAGRARTAMVINGGVPGPLLRFKEGETVTLRVTNNLDEDSSIHWHGLLVPANMDGVPGVSFPGIKPGETFTYSFTLKQSGTYWYHSHSSLQEQSGVYGSIVIEPKEAEPYQYDRDYVVMLSDWTDEDPHKVLANLKKRSDYFNYDRRTIFDFLEDVNTRGWAATVSDRAVWGRMRMDPTDISDVGGYTFLMNGAAPVDNWTALFGAGERVRLRIINGSAMTFFDVRIPGLEMVVVQADGQDVEPVRVDELRIAVAETYDVIVRPQMGRAYTIFAEAMDRSGYARGTLSPREGMEGPIPASGERPLRTIADMRGMMSDMGEMDMGEMDMGEMEMGEVEMGEMEMGDMGGETQMQMPEMDEMSDQDPMAMSGMEAMKDDGEGMSSEAGLVEQEHSAYRKLSYADLRAVRANYDPRPPEREVVVRLTGNMERYFWSLNGKKYSQAEPIQASYGERIRIKFVNGTMMEHPMHLHGMWMELVNGNGAYAPRKHTISIGPGETVYVDVSVDAPGQWAFHCHLLYHMDTGMFTTFAVSQSVAQQ